MNDNPAGTILAPGVAKACGPTHPPAETRLQHHMTTRVLSWIAVAVTGAVLLCAGLVTSLLTGGGTGVRAAATSRRPEPGTRPSLIPPGRLRTRHAITA
jgi:hypothetical protein